MELSFLVVQVWSACVEKKRKKQKRTVQNTSHPLPILTFLAEHFFKLSLSLKESSTLPNTFAFST